MGVELAERRSAIAGRRERHLAGTSAGRAREIFVKGPVNRKEKWSQ